MTWLEIAREQKAAASRMIVPNQVYPRAACSRAYYAVYALLASKANPNARVSTWLAQPSAPPAPEIVKTLEVSNRKYVLELITRLIDWRIVSPSVARERVRDCAEVFRIIG